MTAASPAPHSERSPIDAIFDQAGFSAERLAALGQLLEGFANNLSAGLGDLSCTPFQVSIGAIESAQINAKLREYAGSVGARLKCGVPDGRAWMLLEPVTRNALMAAAFGSDREAADGASLPMIEFALISQFFELAARALNAAFECAVEFDCAFEEILIPSMDQDAERRDAQTICVHCALTHSLGAGALILFLPAAAMQSLRQAAPRGPSRRQQGADGQWADELRAGVDATEVTVRAVVDQFPMSLGAISKLAIGAVMELRTLDAAAVTLHCGDRPLFACDLGQEGGRYTLSVRRSAGGSTLAKPLPP